MSRDGCKCNQYSLRVLKYTVLVGGAVWCNAVARGAKKEKGMCRGDGPSSCLLLPGSEFLLG